MTEIFSETEECISISQARIPTAYGDFTGIVYECGSVQHLALVKGKVSGEKGVLVRVHSECLTGDVFGSKRCDCGMQLHSALQKISAEKTGVLLYMRGQEGRGIGLRHKLEAYTLQDEGLDTVEANVKLGLPIDARKYEMSARILLHLGLSHIRILTNNPAKYKGLEEYGLTVIERLPLPPLQTKENTNYLKAKKEKLGHLFELDAYET